MAINNSLSNRLCFLLALTCGFILANMYYAQSILTDIATGIGVTPSDSGVIITLAQIGYCLGVLFLVPLGDKLENKRLILSMILAAILSLCLLGTVRYKPFFFIALILLGIFCSSVQLIIPYASGVASENQRGKVVGTIITGAIFGIVLARPIASMITESFSWRYAFLIPAICMLIIALLLAIYLPKKYPEQNTLSYSTIFKSMLHLLVNTSTLKVRIVIMALVFFCFTSFWATTPMILQNELDFTHRQIALFSLLSIVTPVCAFIAGRIADKGFALITIVIGICLIAMAFLITPIAGFCITSLVISVLLLDSGANTTNVVIQQSVIGLNQQARSRLNALCITFTFGAGATGSFLGPWLYNHFSWTINAYVGSTLMGITLMIIIVSHVYFKTKF